jgi:DNA modification methylase
VGFSAAVRRPRNPYPFALPARCYLYGGHAGTRTRAGQTAAWALLDPQIELGFALVDGNLLYYGDNLDVLRRHVKDESIDLVYLDPPFNSNASYNVLFAEHGAGSPAQIRVFEDTWHWDESAAYDYEQSVEQGGPVADALRAFRTLLGTSDMLAYLAMMAPRLVELHRVMRPTASIYLHCDPTASHYLKLLMDAVFGPQNFRNEIVWSRTAAKALMTSRLPSNHDLILAYRRSDQAPWNADAVFAPYDLDALDEKTDEKYTQRDADGRRYQLTSLINPSPNRPHLTYEFLGITRVWRWTRERMEAALEAGLVVQPRPGAVPRFKRYLDEQRGKPLGDVWSDIPPINSRAAERLGYPTQKPQELLERLIRLASHEGDLVLDPFCGCGTTIAAAQALNRRWIGIDITHLAIGLIKHRLTDTYGPVIASTYSVVGEPTDVDGARELAASDPFQFQAWALGLVGARVATSANKGGDKGIDGRLYFHEGRGDTKQIIISVKAGHLQPTFVDALVGVVQKEGAQIGVLISFNEPTRGMRAVAASAGFYESPWGKHPRIQLLTVGELLEGARIDYPQTTGSNVTYKKAQAAKVSAGDQLPLVAEGGPDEPYGDDSSELET